ncbi:MAG: response regulator [Proteobacteria bacterium]|nr:response regulator [Pseudomonadota bacterium]
MPPHDLQRILYVEDAPDIQAIVKLALEKLGGFTVEICSSGAEALARAPAFRPDVILVDVMMPGMDGMTTLSELRKIPEVGGVPVVFVTAKVMPSEVKRYREAGVLDVIAKPFDPMTLAARIKAIWVARDGG